MIHDINVPMKIKKKKVENHSFPFQTIQPQTENYLT